MEPEQEPRAEPAEEPAAMLTEQPPHEPTAQATQEQTLQPSDNADTQPETDSPADEAVEAVFTQVDILGEPSSPYQQVFDGGAVPTIISSSETGIIWQSGSGMMMRARSSVQALSVAYLAYAPEPMLAGKAATLTVHAEGGDGEYRYMMALYYNAESDTERFTTADQQAFTFQASPVFKITFDRPGYYMAQIYLADSSGGQLVWSDTKFLVTTAADYSDPAKVAGKVAQLAAQCKAAASTPYARALWLHDWLTANADYDDSLTIYKPEGVLLLGSGVCDSYARAYQLLCQAVGIPCLYVSHTGGNHSWNMVKLGGYWYHVDVTWDDPTGGGRENHRYFLVSDDSIRRLDPGGTHDAWYDSTGQVPPAPYNWGDAPSPAPTPAPTAVVNQEPKDFTEGGLTFSIMDGEAYLAGVSVRYDTAVSIPASVRGYPVRGILPKAFSSDGYISVLRSLKLPEGLRSIASQAFSSVRLPGTLVIPASVTSIGAKAFERMDQTTGYQVASGSSSFASRDGVLYTADMGRIIKYPPASTASSFTLPATVTRIDDDAFVGAQALQEIKTSSNVLVGTPYAFNGPSLTIYGKEGTDLQAELARYYPSQVPTYIVQGGIAPAQPGLVTITQELSQNYNGKSVPVPAYTAIGDGEVTVSFFEVLPSGRSQIGGPPALPGSYVVLVSQAATTRFTAASDERAFTIRPAPAGALTAKVFMDSSWAYEGDEVVAKLSVSGGTAPYRLLQSLWLLTSPTSEGTRTTFDEQPLEGYLASFASRFYYDGRDVQFYFKAEDATGATVEAYSNTVSILPLGAPMPGAVIIPGDADANGTVTVADAARIIDYLVSRIEPKSMTNADSIPTGELDMADLMWLIDRLVAD